MNVAPQSLYLAQLEERLGSQALKNIGYSSNSRGSFQENTLRKLPGLVYEKDPKLGTDIAMYRPVNTSSFRGNRREYGAERALDGKAGTYWATDDSLTRVSFEVDMEGPALIHAAAMSEAAGFEGRILEYKLEGQVDSDWKLLAKGKIVGTRKVDQFPAETVWKVRLTITKLKEHPTLEKFSLYTQ
jgi:alpha-L-fucosidase